MERDCAPVRPDRHRLAGLHAGRERGGAHGRRIRRPVQRRVGAPTGPEEHRGLAHREEPRVHHELRPSGWDQGQLHSGSVRRGQIQGRSHGYLHARRVLGVHELSKEQRREERGDC